MVPTSNVQTPNIPAHKQENKKAVRLVSAGWRAEEVVTVHRLKVSLDKDRGMFSPHFTVPSSKALLQQALVSVELLRGQKQLSVQCVSGCK